MKQNLRRSRILCTFVGMNTVGKSTLIDLILFMTSISNEDYSRRNAVEVVDEATAQWMENNLEAVLDHYGENEEGGAEEKKGDKPQPHSKRRGGEERLRVEYLKGHPFKAGRRAEYEAKFHNQVVIGLEKHKHGMNVEYKPSYLLPVGNPVHSTTSCLVRMRYGGRYQLRVKFDSEREVRLSAFALINDFLTHCSAADAGDYSLDLADAEEEDDKEIIHVRMAYMRQFNELTKLGPIGSAEDLYRMQMEKTAALLTRRIGAARQCEAGDGHYSGLRRGWRESAERPPVHSRPSRAIHQWRCGAEWEEDGRLSLSLHLLRSLCLRPQ